MINKIAAIRNIGRLEKCSASGDVTFRKLTLIYAENGRGKTTLTEIFRSLATGRGDLILGRQTLGSEFPPSACVLIDEGTAVNFKDGKWDGKGPRLAIYDSTFVHQNVYAGDHIDHDHKKNLYRVIVGEAGVALAREVDEYDGKIREANKDVNARAGVVKASLPSGMKLETFLGLPADPNVATKIAAKQAEIAALAKAKEIKEKPDLATIAVAQLPSDFEALLAKELADVSKEAEAAVKKHLATHVKPGGEAWLGQGLSYSNEKTCPFCGLPTDGLSLISDFQKYFSGSYAAFKTDLATLQRSVEIALGESALLATQKSLADNAALVTFWSQFTDIAMTDLPFADIQSAVSNLRKAALARLNAKLASPLEPAPADGEFTTALSELQDVSTRAQAYSEAALAAKVPIATKKKQTENGNLAKANSELAGLQAIQKRQEAAVDEACSAYIAAGIFKNELDAQKAAAKAKLDQHSEDVVTKYEKRINQLLLVFGAGFRIGETKTSYVGGNVSSSFHIVINNVAVALGDAGTPAAQACFRNTLSAGDRSTLALAFFIAQLESDPRLPQTVVVFDDPFTSQDRSRRTHTKNEICRLAKSARQVIAMSHDPGFLKVIKDSTSSKIVRTLQLMRLGERNSTIGDCEIDDLVQDDYFENYNILHKYLHYNDGIPRLVVRSIRPLLEGYLRMKLPKEFKPKEWLGDMIGKIRNAPTGSQLGVAKEILDDLDAINDFSKRYHHDEGAEVEGEPIDDGELQTFISRTFEVVGGF
jgi:wobble nucleotide-excising tRNase